MDPITLVITAIVAVIVIIVIAKFVNPAKPAGVIPAKPSVVAASKAQADSAAKDAAPSADDNQPTVDIYYGSQTGTAEGYAKQIASHAKKLGYKTRLLGLAKYKREDLMAGGVAIFLVATYGEGDPTDDAIDFTVWLKSPSTPKLPNLKFAVFGLGNRQYEQYNKMGQVTDGGLAALGAERFYRRGEGDDNANMEEDFETWREGLWPALSVVMRKDGDSGAPANGAGAVATDVDVPDLPDFTWTVVPATPIPRRERLASASLQNIDVASRHFFTSETAIVRAHRELRQVTSSESSTKHIEFELPAGVVYNTAGNMYILPENDAEQVEQVAKSLGYNLDETFTLQPANPDVADKPLFPTPCTVRDLLTKYTDLNGAARKEFLGFLVHFAVDATEKKRLMHLISKHGRDEFHSWVVEAKRSVAEVLCAFPGLKIPLQAFVHIAPRLHPRAYTIASSATVSPRAAAAVITIVNESKPGSDGRRLKGVCSNFTYKLSVGSQVQLYIRPSSFALPADPLTPILLIGPGTGIAPMRAFLEERAALKAQGTRVGETLLFFGCRKRDEDYIYREEIQQWVSQGVITGLHLAFSREQEKKVYVQHRIVEEGETLSRLILEQRAHIYVCGATSMGSDVLHAFQEVLNKHGKLALDAAKAHVKTMQDEHRYVQELWG